VIQSWSGQVALRPNGRLGALSSCEALCAQSCANARPFLTCIEPCLKACGLTPAELPAKIGEVINAGIPVPAPAPTPTPAPAPAPASSSATAGVPVIVWLLGGALALGAAIMFAGGRGRMRANP